jgi:polysaccharide deacetylase family protein (PEP-CTERM system associated)
LENGWMFNILSFDIEEYFQVSGLEQAVARTGWDKHQSRVEYGANIVLDILAKHDTKATFFILGWIAERHAGLIKTIASQGHEIANHGYDHKLLHEMSDEEFRGDIIKTNSLLENIAGQSIIGYRAPSFSLSSNDLARFEILSQLGFKYDSSLFPVKHFRYGKAVNIDLAPHDISRNNRILLKEFPMTVVDYFGRRIPAGGGGYFRLYPDFFLRMNFRKVNRQKRPVIIYLHPWEFDPDQPRLSGAGFGNTFRHYYNLRGTKSKLESILREFKFVPFRDFLQ